MTKNELQQYIVDHPTFVCVNGPEKLEETRDNGDKVYFRNILKRRGTTPPDSMFAAYINIYYIVRNEGLPDEEAFLMEFEPEDFGIGE